MRKNEKKIRRKEEKKMDKLPKDLIFKLTEELSPQDFVSFCASNTSENIVRVCNMEEIWDKRLEKDFPYIIQNFDFTNKHKKEIYVRVFTSISDISDFLTDKVLEEYGEDMQRFLTSEFKKFLYDKFYKLCEETLKYVIEKEEFLNKYSNDWAMNGVEKVYYNEEFIDFKKSYFPGKKEEHGYFDMFWDDIITYEVKTFVEELIIWALHLRE